MLNKQLQKKLADAIKSLGASSSTYYVQDQHWPGEIRLVAMSGVRFVEPMFGFVYPNSAEHVLMDGDEELFQSTPVESPRNWAVITSEIPEENRRLFGDFHIRERVESFARLTKRDTHGNRDAILFVNYDRRIKFDKKHQSAIRSLFAALVTEIESVREGLVTTDAVWRSEATRIVSPSQSLTTANIDNLDEPAAYFNQIIEATLKVLNASPGTGLGVIHLYNAELQVLELRGWYGEINHLDRAKEHSVQLGAGVVSWVALTKRSLVIQDLTRSEFRRIHVSLNDDSRSELAVPLEVGGELIGTMCLESTKAGTFLPHHARSIWYVANKVALAYQLDQQASMNKKLLELCWRATSEDDGAHVSLDHVATLAKDYLNASECDISRCNSDNTRFDTGGASYVDFVPHARADGWTNFIRNLKCPVWISDIKSVSQYTIHFWDRDHWISRSAGNDHPKKLNDAAVQRGVRSALGIPITVHGKCVGVAWVRYKRERLECPRPGLMSLAVGFAAEAGLVLDSIQRQEVDLKERGEVDDSGDGIARAISDRWMENDSALVDAEVCSRPFHWKLGGDLYARKIIDDKTVGILLLDGQGHGVGGSLHMLPLMTAFESASDSYSTVHVVSMLARTAKALGVRGTAIYCIFSSMKSGKWLSVTTAGHESLIVFKKEERGKWEVLNLPKEPAQMLGHPLGLGHPLTEPFMDHRIQVSTGDMLVGYTDGLAEQRQVFDASNVTSVVLEQLRKSVTDPKLIGEAIMGESQKAHLPSFDDDATVFVVRIN